MSGMYALDKKGVVCQSNSSTTPLLANATFTGSGSVSTGGEITLATGETANSNITIIYE